MNQRVLVLFGVALLPLMMGCATARVARLPKDQTLTKESAVLHPGTPRLYGVRHHPCGS
jgi:hypothetical protein